MIEATIFSSFNHGIKCFINLTYFAFESQIVVFTPQRLAGCPLLARVPADFRCYPRTLLLRYSALGNHLYCFVQQVEENLR